MAADVSGSRFLSAYEFMALWLAIVRANYAGLIFNVHLSITWSTFTSDADEFVAARQAAFLDRIRSWCAGLGQLPAWIWVLERGRRRGLHSHILACVPLRLASSFETCVHNVLEEVTGSTPIFTTDGCSFFVRHDDDYHLGAQWSVFRYLMKGLNPEAQVVASDIATGIRPLHVAAMLNCVEQGLISVPRAGIAEELSAAEMMLPWSSVGLEPIVFPISPVPAVLYSNEPIQWAHKNPRLADLLGRRVFWKPSLHLDLDC